MDEKGSLGIFLSRDKAVAVWTSAGSEFSVLHKLCITPDENEPAAFPVQVARSIIRQGFVFDEVFVAIGCGGYTQYSLHSEFTDTRQIESTIKFDVEEAAAADAVNLAVAFELTATDQTGSQVTAYTAERQLLTDVLLDVQEGGLDPTLMEPDAVCLARAIEPVSKLSDRPGSLFIALSEDNCYMIHPNPGYAPMIRTFLVKPGKAITDVLIREVLLAVASSQTPLESIVLIGGTDAVDISKFGERVGLDVLIENPEKTLSQDLAADSEITVVELLAAYGAAMAGRIRGHKTDFRKDFMPYQGKRKVMESSLRLIGIAATVLLLAVAVFFQLKTMQMKKYARQLEVKTLEQHKAVMYGKDPIRGMQVSSSLERAYKTAKNSKEGLGPGDDKSVPAKMTFFLEAVNKCPKNVDIIIQQVTIAERSMKVKGDTNSRGGTMALFNEIKKHPRITLASQRFSTSSGRDTFEITIEPKK